MRRTVQTQRDSGEGVKMSRPMFRSQIANERMSARRKHWLQRSGEIHALGCSRLQNASGTTTRENGGVIGEKEGRDHIVSGTYENIHWK